MGFLTLSKFLLILILPFLLFLLVSDFIGFDNSFYNKKFTEYQVEEKIPDAFLLHQKVLDFIKSNSNELPNEFNDREKQHLLDVKNIIKILTIILYVFIILFVLLLVISAFVLKVNNFIINFVGKVLIFGGFLTIIIAAALFFFINSNFSVFFESFHNMFFQKGTYLFDPAKEVIVNLYPEQLFMDLGIRVSEWIIVLSVVIILLGAYFIFKTKKQK